MFQRSIKAGLLIASLSFVAAPAVYAYCAIGQFGNFDAPYIGHNYNAPEWETCGGIACGSIACYAPLSTYTNCTWLSEAEIVALGQSMCNG
jgi:hypothetical protein